MHLPFWISAVLAVPLTAFSLQAQSPIDPPLPTASFDMAINYASERAQIAPGKCGCFWLQGGDVDAAFTFLKGFGLAGSVAAEHLANYAPGLNLTTLAYLGGVRFTHTYWTPQPFAHSRLKAQIFLEGLGGRVNGLEGAFPSPTGLRATAHSRAVRAGAGVNLFWGKRMGVRIIEADYVRTELPNNFSALQNDFRLATGLTFRFGPSPAPKQKIEIPDGW